MRFLSGPTKLSIIPGCRIKRVSVERGSTVFCVVLGVENPDALS